MNSKDYIYPLTVFDRTIYFKTLGDMNHLVYRLFNPSARVLIQLNDYPSVVKLLQTDGIDFYDGNNMNEAIHIQACEYIEAIKTVKVYQYLTSNDHDLIIWGYHEGYKKCLEISK